MLGTTSTLSSPEILEIQSHVQTVVPKSILQLIEVLFEHSRIDGVVFLQHFLRHASIEPLEDQQLGSCHVAILKMKSIWDLTANPTYNWPYSYDTTSKYFRLLCTIGVFLKRKTPRNAEICYHFPLRDYRISPDTYRALDLFARKTRARKYRKVINAAQTWKSCLLKLSAGRASMLAESPAVDSPQVAEELLVESPAVDSEKQGLSLILLRIRSLLETQGTDLAVVMMRINSILAPYFLSSSKVSAFLSSEQILLRGQKLVDSEEIEVDSQEHEGRHSDLASVDSHFEESTSGLFARETSIGSTSANLPGKASGEQGFPEESTDGPKNLPEKGHMVDSAPPIDNDITLSSITQLEKKVVIDAPQKKESLFSQEDYRQFNVREATELARFVEQKPQNFAVYIKMSKLFPEVLIRAAVVNMLANTYFPDLTGEMTEEENGVWGAAWGRPGNPGRWVWSCCRNYLEKGLPSVMKQLLKQYEHKRYPEIEQSLRSLERQYSPEQFWRTIVQQLALSAEELDRSEENVESERSHGGLLAREMQQIIERVNREGASYEITARLRPLPGDRFEIVLEQQVNGRTVIIPKEVRSEQDWLEYLALLEEVSMLE